MSYFCSAKYDVFMSFFWNYVLKMPKYGKICDSELQIGAIYQEKQTVLNLLLQDRTTSSQQHENRNSV